MIFIKYLKPNYFNIQDIIVQLFQFPKTFNYEIDINDYRDFPENYLRNLYKYVYSIKVYRDRKIF